MVIGFIREEVRGAMNILFQSKKRTYKKQIKLLIELIKKEPQNKNAYVGLSVAYWRINHFAEAQRNAEIAMGIDPTLPEPYWVLASIHMVKNEPKEIYFPLAERAYILAPDMIEAIICFGVAHLELGNFQQGVTLFERAIEIDPKNVWARRNLAAGYVKLGEMSKHNKEIINLAKIHPSFYTISFRYLLFLLNSKIGRLFIRLFMIMSWLGGIIAVFWGAPAWLSFAFIFWIHYILLAIVRIWSGQKKLGMTNLIIGILYEIGIVLLFIWLVNR